MSVSIATLVAAVNDHDLDRMLALFHPDYRSFQPAHPDRTFVGSAHVRANWHAMFAGIPDFRAELGRVVQDGATTWCEWTWSGTRIDGRSFEARGVAIFESRDQAIITGTLYMEDVETDGLGIVRAVQGMSGLSPVDGA
ncbi:nuclear transport factor 2 family protein [Cryobacterium sp. HLT2-28]|uniref:nuclear transport factor 2 family protein n=1 Tax=Cryobacterium sp. HLT2-28 TaxID=1259146 RepID=UPI001069BB6C|nr:nuclear transport factor 2 family protein [Cryobacterium sp. HLT2-28]TFB94897.1 nuclear transport factor 2 family protein [Cryobacterium sp. HLT2-28]